MAELASDPITHLARFFCDHGRVFVLTGAGISSASGIPTYRDAEGNWTRSAPITHQDFTGSLAVRKRYWARSMLGWRTIANARPNPAHRALAELECCGRVAHLVTQNVDGLHQRAGSAAVLDLHGRLDTVVCLDCGAKVSRADVQSLLESHNPQFAPGLATAAPDGDADVAVDCDGFHIADCDRCGGMLKPDVVFYGASVPRSRVDAALASLASASAMLVVGSSLATYSGYRFCLQARAEGKPIVAINRGRTRADAMLYWKIEDDCVSVLAGCVDRLAA